MKNFRKINNQERGMTLIESIIAITIMVTAITGPMMLAYQSLRATRDARNQLIATHLASEGVEMVLSIRSNNSAKGISWNSGLTACMTNSCVFDLFKSDAYNPTQSDISTPAIDCGTSACPANSQMYVHKTLGIYVQPASARPGNNEDQKKLNWDLSPFRRTITITALASPHVYRITSTVYFKRFNGTEGNVVVTDDMYDWFPTLN